MNRDREQIEFDVLFVGGGPANLAGAIHLMKLAKNRGLDLEVALVEKGADIGSHALSGAVLNPIALKELMTNYREAGCPIETDVRGDEFYFLTKSRRYTVPFVPRYMHNKGFHIISLSKFVSWLATLAEDLGVNIFPGFAGKEVLYDQDDRTVIGVRTGDKGVGKDGIPKANFEPGIDILAKVTVFGEGARGSLLQAISKKLPIFEGKMPQVFETGIKEVIQLPETNYFSNSRGNDIHTFGYPLGLNTHGGGFIYEMKDHRISLGLIVGLSYQDPMLDLYEEFIRFKRHPFVAELIKGGRVIEQGARTIVTGGYYNMPKLAVDGGLFVGSSASMLNAPALKGIHTSMKSGMLAAEAIVEAFSRGSFTRETLNHYHQLFEDSWLKKELYIGRNFAQAVSKKGLVKFLHVGAQYLTGGRGIFDKMPMKEDAKRLRPLKDVRLQCTTTHKKQAYDGVLYVDKLTGVYLSKTQHREDQPGHLIVHDQRLCVNECFETYRCPCTRFCPGNVYELEIDDKSQERRLRLNPSNCLHCKTCDIKDPYGNITWTCPEGGDGPRYTVV
ncbi:MAG: electron transfer flavoprotein-ubiquinone oxidoreductase [Deltaproteobacteria bacterium]|nr:electron transfer flavoprotein-ubiquinone oxidoreductase [Deltaproteobacteria bacterium]MBW2075797.1 electron transfer flavoprotein-ubiquinone oxidoreductase [Deltaproteobacteria bacterium]RLB81357.1 MAG: electron transfer flavoprotein-ubiquinone oxidoreductase [Deltaproteobacteria bacterium]